MADRNSLLVLTNIFVSAGISSYSCTRQHYASQEARMGLLSVWLREQLVNAWPGEFLGSGVLIPC